MVAQAFLLASGLLVLFPIPQEWDTEPRTLVISFETEQFRGRAVRASRDLWIRALLIFPRDFPPEWGYAGSTMLGRTDSAGRREPIASIVQDRRYLFLLARRHAAVGSVDD